MLTINQHDWNKVTAQKMAIRMAPTANDLDGHAYGLYEPVPYDRNNLMAMLQPPTNWNDRLYNTMVHMTDYGIDKDRNAPWFLLLIKDTVRCDQHWFPVRELNRRRGDGNSFPRVNLRLQGANPSVVSYYLMEDLLVNRMPETQKIEAWCDLVVSRIRAAP